MYQPNPFSCCYLVILSEQFEEPPPKKKSLQLSVFKHWLGPAKPSWQAGVDSGVSPHFYLPCTNKQTNIYLPNWHRYLRGWGRFPLHSAVLIVIFLKFSFLRASPAVPCSHWVMGLTAGRRQRLASSVFHRKPPRPSWRGRMVLWWLFSAGVWENSWSLSSSLQRRLASPNSFIKLRQQQIRNVTFFLSPEKNTRF